MLRFPEPPLTQPSTYPQHPHPHIPILHPHPTHTLRPLQACWMLAIWTAAATRTGPPTWQPPPRVRQACQGGTAWTACMLGSSAHAGVARQRRKKEACRCRCCRGSHVSWQPAPSPAHLPACVVQPATAPPRTARCCRGRGAPLLTWRPLWSCTSSRSGACCFPPSFFLLSSFFFLSFFYTSFFLLS